MNRADFPILGTTVPSGKSLVYLDNGASSQKPRAVTEAISRYYEQENANVHRGLHYLADLATGAYEGARQTVAGFVNAGDDAQVIFTAGTTESINLVATGWGRKHLGPGDVILISRMEHHSNIVPWQLCAQATGATLRYLDVEADGTLEAVDAKLDASVKLVALTHVSNALGTVNPVAEIIGKAHAIGAKILIDGAQSVPHMPVDFAALDADWLAFSGHKLCGPTGVGILIGKTERLEEMDPWQGGGEMIDQVFDDHSTWADLPYKLEAGTPNMAGAVGLAAAMDYLSAIGLDVIEAETRRLSRACAGALGTQDDVTLYGPDERGAAISFTVDEIHPHDLAQIIDQDGVAIRAGHLCCQPLMKVLGVPAVARASFYFYNSDDDIDRLVSALDTARSIFRR